MISRNYKQYEQENILVLFKKKKERIIEIELIKINCVIEEIAVVR